MNEDKKHVLLVEDDRGDAVLVERTLAHCAGRFELVVASTLAQAIDELTRQAFDVILLDLSLPDSFGIDGVARVSADYGETPVVVLTGLSDNSVALQALECGAQDYLVKGNTSGETLERTIRHAIQRHEIKNENVRLVRELERLALHDALTGLLNRHAFNEEVEREWKRCGRSGSPLTCVMLDADFFKNVNDTYGHAAGDQVLRNVADVLRDCSRVSDCIARFGGEEFCVLLPETDEQQAVYWADRVRERIATASICFENNDVRITASFGVSQRLEDTASPGQLLSRADEALIVAKKLGRNQVIAFGQMNAIGQNDNTVAADVFDDATAHDIMLPFVLQVRASQPLAHALDLLVQTRLESLPLVDERGQLIGLIGEEDLTGRLLSDDVWEVSAGEIANRRSVCFRKETPVTEICEFLRRAAVRRVVVVDETQKPIGTISRGIILRWLRNRVSIDSMLSEGRSTASSGISRRSENQSPLLRKLADRVDRFCQDYLADAEDAWPSIIGGASQIQELLEEALAQRDNDVRSGDSIRGHLTELWA